MGVSDQGGAPRARIGGEQQVTPLELFFDLVFVFALTQVTGFLLDHLTWVGMLQGGALLAALWTVRGSLPGAIDTPFPELPLNCWPPWEVVGQQPPLAAALKDVEDGIEDLTKVMDPQASISCGGEHVRFYVVPFGVGKIRRVSLSYTC
jgi:Bacterial low temperature requirement A protein (LtrA)